MDGKQFYLSSLLKSSMSFFRYMEKSITPTYNETINIHE